MVPGEVSEDRTDDAEADGGCGEGNEINGVILKRWYH